MNRKKTVLLVIALSATISFALPSANNFHAVTNDWYNGNFTNVYELAQIRLAANSNDVVGAYLMLDWHFRFSGNDVVSNSISRVIAASDRVQNPAFTNAYMTVRSACLSYRDELLPLLTDTDRQEINEKSSLMHVPFVNEAALKILWDEGLW